MRRRRSRHRLRRIDQPLFALLGGYYDFLELYLFRRCTGSFGRICDSSLRTVSLIRLDQEKLVRYGGLARPTFMICTVFELILLLYGLHFDLIQYISSRI
jgi:hypothetical protein